MATMDTSSIFGEYFTHQRDAFKKYGPRTVVWMEVGTFFEMYGLRDPLSREIDATFSPIVDVAEICNQLTVTDKHLSFSIDKISRTVVMAGFRDYAIDRYSALAVDANYTVVVYRQDRKSNSSGGGKMTRILSEVHSPGTYVAPDSTQMTNHIMSIWFDVHSTSTGKNNATIMVCGISVVNIVTGKSMLFEYMVNPLEWIPSTFDELERFLSIYCPSELVVILPETWTKEKEGSMAMELASCSTIPIHYVSLRDSVEARRCQQQVYIQHVLVTTFSFRNDNNVFQQCQEFHEYPTATHAYCFLLHFLKEHNPSLIHKIALPHFESGKKHMVLANHTLRQLNILAVSPSSSSKKLSSVADFTNQCKTATGKRQFYDQLVRPTFDVDWLQQEYDAIANLLQMDMECDHVVLPTTRKCLVPMIDLESAQRGLIARKWTVDFILRVHNTLKQVKQIFFLFAENISLLSYFIGGHVHEFHGHIDRILHDMEHHFSGMDNDTSASSTYLFRRGVFPYVDKLMDQKEENTQSLEVIRQTFNRIMTVCEKGNALTEYVRIHETEKSGMSLVMTKKRAATLRKYLLDKEGDKMIVFPVACISPNASIPKKDIQLSSAGSSNDEIVFPLLTTICRELCTNKEQMISAIQFATGEYQSHFEERFFASLQQITEFVKRVDILQSKCYLAKENHYCRPTILSSSSSTSSPSFVSAKGLRHALIEHIHVKEKYVPNDIALQSTSSLPSTSSSLASSSSESTPSSSGILLYGTNAVGKTSLIRALGIAVIMAQAGMYVPASVFEYIPYKSIFSRILGNDNLFKGLSTFAVEMSELRVILHSANEHSLVLGDELCSGTETESALSIFAAGLVHLARSGASFIFATHFHEIEKFEEIKAIHASKQIVTKHMAVFYDREKDQLMYDRVLKDGPGNRMYGLEVAKSLHLPTSFIDAAYAIRNIYFPVMDGPLSFPTAKKYNAKKVRGICELCQINVATETHHIVEQKMADETGYISIQGIHKNHLSNLMALCNDCHALHHHPTLNDPSNHALNDDKMTIHVQSNTTNIYPVTHSRKMPRK